MTSERSKFNHISIIKGHPIDEDLLSSLIEEEIIVEFRDCETGSKYFSLKPDARRAVFGLPEPIGFIERYFKMNKKTPSKGLEYAPGGRTVPESERILNKVEEVEKDG